MTKTNEWKKTQPGSTEAVQFSDGMLVTAEDLSAAMRYPLSVAQVLFKAFFGCGIVCGLDLKTGAKAVSEQREQRNPAGVVVHPRSPKTDADYVLTIGRGVALGCDGYPIEVCGPLKLDLTPDPCRPEAGEKTLFIAVRRVTAAEAAARPCGCGSAGGEPAKQCTRMRDHVLVQAFDEERDLPKELCRAAAAETPGATGTRPQDEATSLCACLRQCGESDCCGDPWVLLGTVTVSEEGLEANLEGRRDVKPIACVCGAARNEAVAERPREERVAVKAAPKPPAGEPIAAARREAAGGERPVAEE